MHTYSDFFTTLHDETKPVGSFGRGTHYSILRTIVWHPVTDTESELFFHDFAVIWDEDHDARVVWIIEQMFRRGLLRDAIAIGERKGLVTVLTGDSPPSGYDEQMQEIAEEQHSDRWESTVGLFPRIGEVLSGEVSLTSRAIEAGLGIVATENEQVVAYLAGIDATWQLGLKTPPFPTRAI